MLMQACVDQLFPSLLGWTKLLSDVFNRYLGLLDQFGLRNLAACGVNRRTVVPSYLTGAFAVLVV